MKSWRIWLNYINNNKGKTACLSLAHLCSFFDLWFLTLPSPTGWISWVLFLIAHNDHLGFPRWLSGKESSCNAGDAGSILGWGRAPGERKWQPTPVFLPWRSHGQRSLVDSSPWSCRRVGHDWAIKQQWSFIRFWLFIVCLGFQQTTTTSKEKSVTILFWKWIIKKNCSGWVTVG